MRRLPALAFPLALAALLATNLITVARNAESRPYRRTSDSMYAAARDSSVHTYFGVYHYLRRRMQGKHLTIPLALREHAWFLRRVSRVEVDVVAEVFELSTPQVRRLRQRSDRALWLRVGGRQSAKELYYFHSQSATRYLIAQSPTAGTLLLMPEEMYHSLGGRTRPAGERELEPDVEEGERQHVQ